MDMKTVTFDTHVDATNYIMEEGLTQYAVLFADDTWIVSFVAK